MEAPIVFLDTTTLKFAAERIIRGFRRRKTVVWGGQTVTREVVQFVEIYPNAHVNEVLARELRCLPFLAHLARRQRVRLTTHHEVIDEFHGLPKTDDPAGVFWGAPIERSPDPFEYGRLMAAAGCPSRDFQFEFVRSLRHRRFDQLKVAVGAVDPRANAYRNQCLDAFHLLCAEHASAEYFLTVDLKLIRHVSMHKRWPPQCRAVAPRTLVDALLADNRIGIRDVWTYLAHLVRARWKPKSSDPMEQLVGLGRHLEQQGYYDKE